MYILPVLIETQLQLGLEEFSLEIGLCNLMSSLFKQQKSKLIATILHEILFFNFQNSNHNENMNDFSDIKLQSA